MTTEEIHETGVKRHGAMWARSNQRAVDSITNTTLKPWSPGVKDIVSRVILRVLDGVRLDGGEVWLKDADKWTRPSVDIARPSMKVLCALGSIAVHSEEFLSPTGHHFDIVALRQLIADPEVSEWLTAMGNAGFLPVKR